MRSQADRAAFHLALTIVCPSCHAAPNDPCTKRAPSGRRVPLDRSVTHPLRTREAERLHHLPFHEAEETEQ